MACICLNKLKNLLAALLPLASLGTLRLSPAMAQLSMVAGALGAPSTSSFDARLALSLPALPLSLNAVEQISAVASATEQLTASFGISPLSPAGLSGLGVTVASLNANLAGLLPLAPLTGSLPALTSLSLALSTVASLRASVGLDLLAPNAALRLNALLAAGIPATAARLNVAAVARASAYAKLSAAAAVFGGPQHLLPSLRLAASLRLPTIRGSLNLLALLAALLGLQSTLRGLGITSLSASAMASLRASLRPLATLPALSLRLAAVPVSTVPTLNASFMASAQALAALNLRAAANLRLPSLAPLSLLASVASQGGLGASSACSASCPVGSRL